MKIYKCNKCGAPIVFEKDNCGKTHAVERTIYYTPDQHGNLLVLTMQGEVIRAVEDKTSDKVGSILHKPRCVSIPPYITASKKRAIDYLPDAPKEAPEQPADIRTSLF